MLSSCDPRDPVPSSRWSVPLLCGLVVALSCDGVGVFKRPLVRVALADKLPRQVRRLAEAGITRFCHKSIRPSDGGISPRLRVAWRVLDLKGDRYIVAVEANPEGDGRVEGVSSLIGSGWVGESRNIASGGQPVITSVPVRVGWSARKGCSKVGKRVTLELRADDPSCKAPKTPKLLRPVK